MQEKKLKRNDAWGVGGGGGGGGIKYTLNFFNKHDIFSLSCLSELD